MTYRPTRRPLVQPLESRTHLAVDVAVNFEPVGTLNTPAPYLDDHGKTFAYRAAGQSYGWNADNAAWARNRNAGAGIADNTLTHLQKGAANKWELAVPNGTYDVTLRSGDASYTDSVHRINVEGQLALSFTPTSAARWSTQTKRVTVTDGRLTVTNASGAVNNKLNWLRVKTADAGTPTNPSTELLWPSSWQQKASSPLARFESAGFEHNGKVYVMGGWTDGYVASKRADVYDVATNTWTQIADLPGAQTHAAWALDRVAGDLYWLSGNVGNYPSVPSQEVWKYHIASNTWSNLNVDLPAEVGGAGAGAMVGRTVYYFGGVVSWDRDENTGKMYALNLDDLGAGWVEKATLPGGRDHLASIVVDGKIYAVGGEYGHDQDHGHVKLVHRYDPATNGWAQLADMPLAKSHAEAALFLHQGKLIYAGGQVTPDHGTSNVMAYTIATNTWGTLAPLPAVRQGAVVLKVGDKIVVTCGAAEYTNWNRATTWVGSLVG